MPRETEENVYANTALMKDNLEYIDDYLNGELTAEDLRLFDQRVLDDPAFAGDVAFYLGTVNAIRSDVNDDRKAKFRKLYEQGKNQHQHKPVRVLMPYLAAAAVIGLISVAIFIFYPVSSPDQLAEKYINENLAMLGVSMGGAQDSLQTALRHYNEGELDNALVIFEQLETSNPSDNKIKEYAGIVSLRLAQYDNALKHFRELESFDNLYANPGKFYVALTLLRRNGPGDVAEAKEKLKQVTEQGLEHDADARKLLNKL